MDKQGIRGSTCIWMIQLKYTLFSKGIYHMVRAGKVHLDRQLKINPASHFNQCFLYYGQRDLNFYRCTKQMD